MSTWPLKGQSLNCHSFPSTNTATTRAESSALSEAGLSLTSNATGPAASADPAAIASKQRQYRWEEEELRTNLGEEAGRVADRATRGGPPAGAAGGRRRGRLGVKGDSTRGMVVGREWTGGMAYPPAM